MGNEEEQTEEMEVLRSIFDENVLTVYTEFKLLRGTFFAEPNLPDDFKVTYENLSNGSTSQVPIKFLPPMKLLFKFVPSYPSTKPPAFLLACQWLNLNQISALCGKLVTIWLESKPQVVLFCWVQFLQEEALSFLGILNHLDISSLCSISQPISEMYFSPPPIRKRSNSVQISARAKYKTQTSLTQSSSKEDTATQSSQAERPSRQRLQAFCSTERGQGEHDERAVNDLINGARLMPNILEWNKKRKQAEFDKEWFICKVCLMEKQGACGFRFNNCEHLYCRECIQAYFQVQIKDGNVQLLNCPEEKCPSQALPSQVYELVGKDLYDRYDKLLLDSALAKMSDVEHCPRPSCQCLSLVDKKGNVGSCSECQFHFCLLCKRAYHGLEPCRFPDEEKSILREKYSNADPIEKLALEQRYGKKNLVEMINESMSREWIQRFSKRCPHCNASIEKSDGCNKMTCWRCNTMFCWLCGHKLKAKEPYLHYNDIKSRCFGFLFHGVDVDSAEDSDEDNFEFGQFL